MKTTYTRYFGAMVAIMTIFFTASTNALSNNILRNASTHEGLTNSLTGTHWSINGNSKNTKSYTVSRNKTYRVQISAYSSEKIQILSDEISVGSGEEYNYSDFYSSNIPSSLVILFKKKNGAYSSYKVSDVPSTKGQWIQLSLRIAPPADTISFAISHEIKQVGYMELGDFITSMYSHTEHIEPMRWTSFHLQPTIVPWRSSFSGGGSSSSGNGITNSGGDSTSSGTNTSSGETSTSSGETSTTSTGTSTTDSSSGQTSTGDILSDTEEPHISFISPVSGSIQSGSIQIALSGSDNQGVAGIQLYIDEISYGSELTSAPYSLSWDSSQVADGGHELTAIARDASGNTGSTSVSITVHNAPSIDVCETNLISNSCLEDAAVSDSIPDSWFIGGYGTNTATFHYPIAGSHGSGAQVVMTSYTDGDAKWYFADVPVEQFSTYTYQESYISDVTTKLFVRYQRQDGTFSYHNISTVPAVATWTTTTAPIQIPEGVISITVFHAIDTIGTLSIDEASLNQSSNFTGTPFDAGMVTFSFDDGWISQLTNAAPVLDANNIHGTFSIITEEMENANLQPPWDRMYMSTHQALSLQTTGHEVTDHSTSHVDLTTLTSSGLVSEIADSRAYLTDAGFAPVDTLVFPYGMHNSTVDQFSKDVGFIGARSDAFGYNTQDTSRFSLLNQEVGAGITINQLKYWIDSAYTDYTWLILIFHRVDSSGTPFAVDPALFTELVNYVKTKGIETVTLHEGLSRMGTD